MRDDAPNVVLDPKAPLAIARAFTDANHTLHDMLTLRHQQSVFMTWCGTHYRELATEEMRSSIYEFLEPALVERGKGLAPFKPTARAVSDILDATRAVAQIAGSVRAPAWLMAMSGAPEAAEIISCRNGLLHLPTGQMFHHTPAFYSTTSLGYDFDPNAPAPEQWLAFLNSIWPDDPEAIDTLQDIFGYLLGSDTDQQKIPMIVGPKRSGKGTIARALTSMVGADAVVSPTLGSLEKQFGVAPLIGKSIALIADARLSSKSDQQAIAERLLSISGEDMQTVDRKHVDSWSGKLSARFFIMTNELPRIGDSSGALAGRFLILTMTRSFYGQEDHELSTKISAEMPGILNWAIEGWRRMRTRGRFIQPATSDEAIRELEDLSSPIGAFLRDCCIVEPGRSASVDGLYESWKSWCHEQGRDFPSNKQTFGRDLRAAVNGLKITQSGGQDHRYRQYDGVGLIPKSAKYASGFDL